MEDEELMEEEDWGEDDDFDEYVEIEHTVMPGCTDIISICAEYGVTDWREVCQYNNIKKPLTDIEVGDIIIIRKAADEDGN